MEVKKIFILGINILFLLIWIGLIGITIWPITGLYGSSPVWWSGNSAVDATKYAGWGAAVGMIGMIIQIAISNIVPKFLKNGVLVYYQSPLSLQLF